MAHRKFLSFCSIVVFSIFLASSCSKSEEVDNDSIEGLENTDETSAELQAAKALYQDYYMASQSGNADEPWSGGDLTQCEMGSVPNGTLEKIVRRITYYRKVVGLENDLMVSSTKSEKAQAAALMMDANNRLDHFPSDDWSCYSDDGHEGAGSSLLTMTHSAAAIDSYMRDAGSSNGHVGHRRWLLYPRLAEIGIGNTSGANAIWVLGNNAPRPDDAPEFIAWPAKGYVPNNLVFDRWSFSVADADFSNASVTMQSGDGDTITLNLETLNNQFGDRTLVWVPDGIDKTVGDNRPTYTVEVSNVDVDGVLQDFSYEVILFDPNE
ncbi:CAP domain-containing protein [Allomuricauda sp. d1]|uniref:CAP domain-containing protein n=1 Tax=Allomuricauda sp. d1 TaxID=3136725 RepID=UPI0031D45D5B